MPQQPGTYDTKKAKDLGLAVLLSMFDDLGAEKIYAKQLAPNDNSKNQPYLAGHLTEVAFLPTGELIPSGTRSQKTADSNRQVKFQAPMNLAWLDPEGHLHDAPNAKLIYYPQYPEVRFSGFLKGSSVNLSEWMNPARRGRAPGRWMILGVNRNGTVYAYLATPGSSLASQLEKTELVDVGSALQEIRVNNSLSGKSTKEVLTAKLKEISELGWIAGQKMNADGNSSRYKAPNGGGYTLEALLGISPNGYAEPDYLGWEVKQFGVTEFPKRGAKPTTLFTPEPDGGLYRQQGAAEFVRRYGYPDKSGVPDRLNIGGKHTFGIRVEGTGLTLVLTGFDRDDCRITDASGAITLLDNVESVAAHWSYTKLIDHWKRKHAQAVYIPCIRRTGPAREHEYSYGADVELGSGTDFNMLLSAISEGHVYYDPGIKLEKASSDSPKLKRRNQFRINHRHLQNLYTEFEFLNVSENGD